MSLQYETFHLSGLFYKKAGWYFLYKPVKVAYENIIAEAEEKGFTVASKAIVERAVAIGKGWIAVEVDKNNLPNNYNEFVIELKGEFTAYTHEGSYSGLKHVYRKIMNDHPKAKEFYSLYLNTPNEVDEKDLKTMILFR